MKKIIIGILILSMCVSLIGCNKNKEDQNNEIQNSDVQTNLDAEEQEKENYRKSIEAIEVDVLSSTTIETEDSIILYTMFTQKEIATLITVGIRLPNENVYYKYFSSVEVCGETATDEEGNPAHQTTMHTFWGNQDKTYLLAVIRVRGEVDTTKASIKIKGQKDDFEIVKSFSNDGKSIGFEEAIEKFTNKDAKISSIIKLKNRHYIIARYYNFSTGSGYNYLSTTRAYILIPLEDGLERTLTQADVTLTTNEPVQNVTGTLEVNRGEILDLTACSKQTTIEITSKRTFTEEEIKQDHNTEFFNKINQDINKFFENSVIEIDDGDGNIITLPL